MIFIGTNLAEQNTAMHQRFFAVCHSLQDFSPSSVLVMLLPVA